MNKFNQVKRLKKYIYIVSILLLFTSCSLFKDIQLNSIKDIRPSIKDKAVIINTSVEINNSNFYNVAVKSTDLQVLLDDKELGNLALVDKVIFKRKTTDTYTLKLKMKMADGALFTILRNVFKKEVSLTFKGKIKGSAFGIPKTININETKTIDASLLKNLTN
jgi:LEA14-like dessication related protein